ncbi:MAG TPA: hypothetical protein VFH40_09110 [Gemmatimonadales bacterium]|nr:hypothetical protein [Gemmatimonadales bacterium]
MPQPWPGWKRDPDGHYLRRPRPPRPFFALFRADDRRELFFRADDRRELFFREEPRRLALLRAEPRLRFLAEVLPPFLAARLADFLELLREAFLDERRADDFRLDFLADLRGAALRLRAGDSPKSS